MLISWKFNGNLEPGSLVLIARQGSVTRVIPLESTVGGMFTGIDLDPSLTDGGPVTYEIQIVSGDEPVTLYSETIDVSPIRFLTQLRANFPNPFNPATNIQFELDHRQKVNVGIYDVRGQLVATLVNDIFDSGSHQITWYGSDRGGRTVSSGIYMIVMRTESGVRTRKIALTK